MQRVTCLQRMGAGEMSREAFVKLSRSFVKFGNAFNQTGGIVRGWDDYVRWEIAGGGSRDSAVLQWNRWMQQPNSCPWEFAYFADGSFEGLVMPKAREVLRQQGVASRLEQPRETFNLPEDAAAEAWNGNSGGLADTVMQDMGWLGRGQPASTGLQEPELGEDDGADSFFTEVFEDSTLGVGDIREEDGFSVDDQGLDGEPADEDVEEDVASALGGALVPSEAPAAALQPLAAPSREAPVIAPSPKAQAPSPARLAVPKFSTRPRSPAASAAASSVGTISYRARGSPTAVHVQVPGGRKLPWQRALAITPGPSDGGEVASSTSGQAEAVVAAAIAAPVVEQPSLESGAPKKRRVAPKKMPLDEYLPLISTAPPTLQDLESVWWFRDLLRDCFAVAIAELHLVFF